MQFWAVPRLIGRRVHLARYRVRRALRHDLVVRVAKSSFRPPLPALSSYLRIPRWRTAICSQNVQPPQNCRELEQHSPRQIRSATRNLLASRASSIELDQRRLGLSQGSASARGASTSWAPKIISNDRGSPDQVRLERNDCRARCGPPFFPPSNMFALQALLLATAALAAPLTLVARHDVPVNTTQHNGAEWYLRASPPLANEQTLTPHIRERHLWRLRAALQRHGARRRSPPRLLARHWRRLSPLWLLHRRDEPAQQHVRHRASRRRFGRLWHALHVRCLLACG